MADSGSRSGRLWTPDRRQFLRAVGVAGMGAAIAACTSEPGGGGPGGGEEAAGQAPSVSFTEPRTKLSGDLKILLWSHFVPSHDQWFRPFAQDWGKKVGVNVSVDHIDNAQIPTRIAAEIQAGQGHDVIQYIAPLSQFEPSVNDLKDLTDEASRRWGQQLELSKQSSFNPPTGRYYAYSPGWVPDPGDYRTSLWTAVGMPKGPTTWDELLEGGAEIKKSKGTQLGIGMSQEIDSNMAGRALMWSYGASVQDENEQVVINSEETVAAVEFMTKLFKQAMTDEVFSWNAASNNQGLVAGKLSYILNSISAWRTAQGANPDVANDVGDVPAFAERVPQLDGWLAKDPYGANPADKLAFLKDATSWSTNIGYPGPSNTAIGEVFGTFVIPNMFASAARGDASPKEAVAQAEAQ